MPLDTRPTPGWTTHADTIKIRLPVPPRKGGPWRIAAIAGSASFLATMAALLLPTWVVLCSAFGVTVTAMAISYHLDEQ